ncbi:YceI family protein [Arhodomonas sp. AD133]|uniref:YceI family protein n=1 Tax=Arhodomonas sp. AD133 TaxID=3415009 RepID=UPI003EBE4B6B
MSTRMLRWGAFALATAPMVATAAQTYEIDSSHTYPYFEVSHLGFSVMGGQFDQTSGSFVLDRDGGNSSVSVTISADSIDTGHEKRDEHLRSDDFFAVQQHPEITYESTEVTFEGEDEATIEGELTMLGKTRPVTLKVNKINCGEHPMNGEHVCGFNAVAEIERSTFGMDYGLPAIGDTVDIRIQAEGVARDSEKVAQN